MAYGKMVRYNPPDKVGYSNKRRRSSYGNGMQNLVRSVPYAGNMVVAGYNSFRTNARAASAGRSVRNPLMGGPNLKRIAGTTGKYGGKFSKLRKYKKTKIDNLLQRGYGRVTEVKGSVSGVDSVYLGVTSMYLGSLADVVGTAVLRKLFKKCGYDISDPNANLELSNNLDTDSAKYRVVRKMEDGSGTTVNVTYDFVAAESLNSLTVNSGFSTSIVDYAQGTNSNICVKVYLARLAGTLDWIQLGSLELVNELVDVQMKTKVSIQNRTAATNGSFDTDRIDSQPLVGKTYKFVRSTPIVNHVGNVGVAPDMTSLFEKWYNNTGGIHLISDQSPGFDSVLKKLPSPVYFNNCKSATTSKLEPGEIKDLTVTNNYTMYYQNFVKKLAWQSIGATAPTKRAQKVGDCVLFGFEERMDSGSAFNITIQYEAENRIAACLKTGRLTAMKENYLRLDFSV